MTESWTDWSWYTGPLEWRHKCYHCHESLLLHKDAGIVRWRDQQLYATACLLTKLARVPPIMNTSPDAATPFDPTVFLTPP